ncbi:MAG: translation initiation factor [Candidatus Aenigmatarchaeota archaeon]
MPEICPKCGLPKELCTCEILAKEREKIRVFTVQRRYGKTATIVQGISEEIDIKPIFKELKTRLACGGTIRDNAIELQGNHKEKIKSILIKLGFPEEQIEIT